MFSFEFPADFPLLTHITTAQTVTTKKCRDIDLKSRIRKMSSRRVVIAFCALAALLPVPVPSYAEPEAEIVFDFDGHRIRLDRTQVSITGLDRRDASIRYWKVDPAYGKEIIYLVDDPSAAAPVNQCSKQRVFIFAARDIPDLLSDPSWAERPTEQTDYPGIVKYMPSAKGFRDLMKGIETYQLRDKKLRSSNGSFPILSCVRDVCKTTFEISKPLYATTAYTRKVCGLEEVIEVMSSKRQALSSRLVE